jgi:putative DNA primase/helicase
MILTVANGTLDLHTGALREHRRADLATKLAPVAYSPDATAPTWGAFLDRILPDHDVQEFVRRAVGYSLTGETGEQVLFLCWGTGANGKTTFIETIMAILGDFALKTPAETLLAKRDNTIPNDVAALRGARFVAAVESEDGRRLAEVRVKELTGGDSVSARFMRAEWFTFKPVAKLWLATNHRPVVRGTDEAIWRRIRLIPFNVTIPGPERDPTLPAQLRAELPGILRWAVDGCMAWQHKGLGAPAAVLAATRSYRAEQDVLGAFIAERCLLAPERWVSSASLYAAYRNWCEDSGEHAATQRALGLALRERGFEDAREGKARSRGWQGVGLLDHSKGGHMADATT